MLFLMGFLWFFMLILLLMNKELKIKYVRYIWKVDKNIKCNFDGIFC